MDVDSAATAACGSSCYSSSAADAVMDGEDAAMTAEMTVVCGSSYYSFSVADSATDAIAANPCSL